MRVKIIKDDQVNWVKPDRLQRFLDKGWQQAQPIPKKSGLKKVVADVVVAAEAEVVKEVDSLPILPTDNQ